MRRVLTIFLDGYEHSLAQRLMSAGEMPQMSRLAELSARFLLDYGSAQRAGLAGEHVATGLSPEAARRWNVVHFDPNSYAVWQEGTRLRPFAADLNCRTVVFDLPYFDLRAAPTARGIVNWGAHDPGVTQASRPSDLPAELDERFGPYPAAEWTYGFAWPSPDKSRGMGSKLAHAVDVRAEAACWLLGERMPDWDLALVSVGEPHSVIEGLWHGIDPTHPLHHLPSAGPAGAGVCAVYHAVDRLIGRLTSRFPDALTVVFAMGGMGANHSDVASMLLLPELMYRHAFGSAFFRQPPEWSLSAGACPVVSPDVVSWGHCVAAGFPAFPEPGLRGLATRLLPKRIKALLRRALDADGRGQSDGREQPLRISLAGWPAARYQRFWRLMPAFALHSYYDGSVRLNLIGRERHGIVRGADYRRVLAEVEGVIRACIDPATGKEAVDFIEYPTTPDPLALESTQADLTVVWKGAATCLEHPDLGRIGPVPYRRTGGHTGPFGMAYFRADNGPVGDKGIRSSFDVVPTIIELMGLQANGSLSGRSLMSNP